MFMQSMHAFAIDTDLHFNTFMSIANSVCNGLKELIDYVHVDEDRVIGSSRMQSYKTVCVEKEGPLSIGYKMFNHATSCFLKLVI